MVSPAPPKIRLMLVRDPEHCIQALCELEDQINLETYKEKYEETRHLVKPIHIKNAHTHFYSLTIFGLIQQSLIAPLGNYEKTKEGTRICKLLKKKRHSEVKKIMRYLLKNNFKKGKLFRDFENFVKAKKKVTFKEVDERYDEITAASLREWSAYANIINYDKKLQKIWNVEYEKKVQIPLKKFKEKLIRYYDKFQESEILGLESVFVYINKIRTEMCLEFNCSNDYWNELMTKLLDSKFGEKIRLYGSIPSEFEGKENFNYNGTLYALIRIKD